MRIKMKETRFGSPDGIKVNEYVAGAAYDVSADLAKDFIAAGVAESEELPTVAPVWPPSEEDIVSASFSALGVLLESKGVALGPLKSVEARQAALRELIAADEKEAAEIAAAAEAKPEGAASLQE